MTKINRIMNKPTVQTAKFLVKLKTAFRPKITLKDKHISQMFVCTKYILDICHSLLLRLNTA